MAVVGPQAEDRQEEEKLMATKQQLLDQAEANRAWAQRLVEGPGKNYADYLHAACLHQGVALFLEHEASKVEPHVEMEKR